MVEYEDDGWIMKMMIKHKDDGWIWGWWVSMRMMIKYKNMRMMGEYEDDD
jgi:hypothetical protein